MTTLKLTAREDKRVHLSNERIHSVDVLRGAVMILMALDHVRVYSGIPAGSEDPVIFFTRWITHFCAPAFVFFAGTSAFLYGSKINNQSKLALYLLSRGFLLVLLELTLIRFLWSFNLNFSEFVLAGVIWMLGWCMIFMAVLVWIRPVFLAAIGLLIITFQSIFKFFPSILSSSHKEFLSRIWNFIYPTAVESWQNINILYTIVPWIGVMATGYAFGVVLLLPAALRKKLCLTIGLGATIFFLVFSIVSVFYGEGSPGDNTSVIMQILNQRKYPASQLFLMMTLGPIIALVPIAEKLKGKAGKVLAVFGRVPMFYYILHIGVIHLLALAVNAFRGMSDSQSLYASAPYVWLPEESRWSVSLLYAVFFVAVFILYFPCKWYMVYKANNPGKKWLKYI